MTCLSLHAFLFPLGPATDPLRHVFSQDVPGPTESNQWDEASNDDSAVAPAPPLGLGLSQPMYDKPPFFENLLH